MRTRILTIVLLTGVLAGCGNEGSTPSGAPEAAGSAPSSSPTFGVTPGAPMPTKIPAASGLVTTSGAVTVIQSGDAPAKMCLGVVMTSLPPQCGGTELRGFTWPKGGDESGERSGALFGAFTLTGHFNGSYLDVVTADPLSDDDPTEPIDLPDFSTRCPQPAGGWRVIDPERTDDATVEDVFAAARKLPGYANSWMDRSRIPKDLPDDSPLQNDPKRIIVNVQVVDGAADAEAKLRKVWGGALCVTEAEHSQQELGAIQRALQALPGMLTSDSGFEHVNAKVVHDDGSLQAWVDTKYGKGLVKVTSALQPVLD